MNCFVVKVDFKVSLKNLSFMRSKVRYRLLDCFVCSCSSNSYVVRLACVFMPLILSTADTCVLSGNHVALYAKYITVDIYALIAATDVSRVRRSGGRSWVQ